VAADGLILNPIEEHTLNLVKEELINLAVALAILLLAFILQLLDTLLHTGIDKNIKGLEKLLKEIATLPAIKEEKGDIVEEIDFNTTKGMSKAIEILNFALHKAQEAKDLAEEANKAKSMFLAN